LDTSKDKRIAELNQMLGNSFYELKKYKEAVPYLEKYATLQPQTREDNYRLGFAYYANKQYALAIARLGNTTKEEDELSQKAWYHLGECYIEENKKTEARSCYDRARKTKFNNEITEDAFYTYARLSYELSFNPYHDAIRIMSDYLHAYPGSMHRDEVYGYLVNMYMAGKNYESAYESLSELGAKTPSMQRAFQFVAYNLGIDYLNKKQYDKAELMLRDVKRYPIDKELGAMSHYWIAETYYSRNDFTASIDEYKNFMQQPGAFKLPLYNRSNYHIAYAHLQLAYAENTYAQNEKPELGNYNLSLDYFRRYLNDNSERDKVRLQDAYLRIGDVYYIKSDNENAAKYYALAVSTPSSSSDYARFQKGICDGLLGKNEDKISGLKELLRLYPNSRYSADAKFEIAQTYSIMDKQREALEYYAKVINDHPENIARVKHARFGTALLHYQLKEYKKSEEYLLKAIALSEEIGSAEAVSEFESELSNLYADLGKYKLALDHFKKHISERDS
ncbi:MAG: tetratricopeptide repeat protein, partial [Flavobacteriales bacterium]